MLPKAKTVYFHVDVNSAFLSWTAIQHLANGETLDPVSYTHLTLPTILLV